MAALTGVNNCSRASERMVNGQERNDIASLSPQARRQTMYQISLPATTQNAVTTSETTPIGANCVVVTATVAFTTIPVVAGGTCTIQVLNGNGAVVITGTAGADSLLGKTNGLAFKLTLATTNPALLTAGVDSLQCAITTSNNAVGTAQVGGTVNIVVEPIEDNPIID